MSFYFAKISVINSKSSALSKCPFVFDSPPRSSPCFRLLIKNPICTVNLDVNLVVNQGEKLSKVS